MIRLLLLCAMLYGCATTAPSVTDLGSKAPREIGWDQYCLDHPYDTSKPNDRPESKNCPVWKEWGK